MLTSTLEPPVPGAELVTNLRGEPGLEGPQGLAGQDGQDGKDGATGTFADMLITMLDASESARVEMTGPETARVPHLFVPWPLPAPEAVGNDVAFAAAIGSDTSKTRGCVRRVTQAPLGVPIEDFLLDGETIDYQNTVGMSAITQRALNTVSATFRPVQILFGPGRIRIDARLVLVANRKGIGLRGAGMYRTTFDLDAGVLGLLTGYGDSKAGTYLENVNVSDLTVDCSRQVADENTSLKAFNLGHIFNSRFENIRVLNSWATAFGVDFPVNVDMVNCNVYGAGRGLHKETVLGSGSSYGIGVGAWPNESIRFINCRSFGAGRMGWNLEWLHDYSVEDFKTKVVLIGCLSRGDAVGIGDLGTKGVYVTGGTIIEEFTNAGIVIGTGGQAPRGGRGGLIDASTVIRHGVKGGRPDQDVYGGHGIVIRGDDTAGGYRIYAQIEDNAGDGINFEPGFRLSKGGLLIGAEIRRNGGAGVRMYGAGEICLGVRFMGGVCEENGEIGLDIRSSTRGLWIKDWTFFSGGKQNTAIRFDPMMTLDSPTVRDNDAYGHTAFMTGHEGAIAPVFENNRRLTSLEAATDPNLIYERTMKTRGTVTGIGQDWTPVTVGPFAAGEWRRTPAGLEPITTGAYNGVMLAAYKATQTGTFFTAVFDPPSVGSGWRGIAICVNPDTGESIVLRAGGDQYYQVVRYAAGSNDPVPLWTGSINPVPGNEKHEMGLYRPAGGTLAYAMLDGVAVWRGSVAAVPETARVGLYASAQGAGVLYNVAIRKPATLAPPISDLPLGMSYYASLISAATVNGLGAGWSPITGGAHGEQHEWLRTASGATPVITNATHGGTGQVRAALVGQRVEATYSTDASSIGVRGVAICVNPATGDMIAFRATTSTGDFEVVRYLGSARTLFFRTGNANPPILLPSSVTLGLQRDVGTNMVRAFVNGVQVWANNIANVAETPNVGVIGNASGLSYLTRFSIYE